MTCLLEPDYIPHPADDACDPFADEWPDDAPQTQPGGVILIARPNQLHAAKRVASLRTALHDGHRTPEQDCGAAGNQRNDHFGLLGEWLVIDALESIGLQPTGYELLRQYPKPGADFWLHGVSFDAKSCPFGSRFLTANERQRLDPRHACDYVLPVIFCGSNAVQVMRPIPYAAIGQWDLRQGHSPYRSVHVSTLAPLQSWEELLP